jgi:hypothetical protein
MSALFLRAAAPRYAQRLLTVAALALALPACHVGDGEGNVTSDKHAVQGCWNGQFDLRPDFFAANPYRRKLEIRVQSGRDIQEVSDGLTVLVDDIDRVRAHLGENLRVGLAPAVVPPGYPVVHDPDPPIVHATLYLARACRAQNPALFSIEGGIVFHSIFNGNLTESNTDEMLTAAEFTDIVVGDPRVRDPVTDAVQNVSHVKGSFKFYFQRGQPAQPFP